ncbi:Uncharacterised protein [Burkholderia pseudomallei]|nr:Uncharacterised protein [Burkholderia pseudomallei]CAJ3910888.1 Uncharacterised protein [Burkholderia pseudomallei]
MTSINVDEIPQYVRTSVVIDALYRTAEQAGFQPDQCAYPFQRLVTLASFAGVTSVAHLDELAKEYTSKIGKLLRTMYELHNPKDGVWRVQKAFMAELVIIFARRDIVGLDKLLELEWEAGPAEKVLKAVTVVSAQVST